MDRSVDQFIVMELTLTAAKGQLLDLARRAERGEDVVFTRHGRPTLRLVPVVRSAKPPGERGVAIDAIMDEGERRWLRTNLGAARSQDFLYDDDGLPA